MFRVVFTLLGCTTGRRAVAHNVDTRVVLTGIRAQDTWLVALDANARQLLQFLLEPPPMVVYVLSDLDHFRDEDEKEPDDGAEQDHGHE